MTTRRSFLKIFGASIAMPALVKAESLMRISSEIIVPERIISPSIKQLWNNLVPEQSYTFRIFYRKVGETVWTCLTQYFKAEGAHADFTVPFPSENMLVANITLESGPRATPYYNTDFESSYIWQDSAVTYGDPVMENSGIQMITFCGFNDQDPNPLRPRITYLPAKPDDELRPIYVPGYFEIS